MRHGHGSACTGRVPPCQRPTESQAHCPTCHHTFGGVRTFDEHRKQGRCLEPEDLGLVQRNGVWRRPMDAATRARLDNRPKE